jgi:sulfatase modifying factor 1
LPSEAEWEYAARGGVDDEISALGDNAREKANFEGKGGSDIFDSIAPVAQFDADRFKLYDMLGNVWEWVNDWYSPTYYGDSRAGVTDPPGPDKGKEHVMRGGSFDSDPKTHLRLSIRKSNSKAENNVGMRCILEESPATRTLLGRPASDKN